MFTFMIVVYIIGAIISFIIALNGSEFVISTLILMIACILNACIFGKMQTMNNDVIAIKKRLGMNEEATQDEAQNQSDNTPSQQG